jgi:hypothetical protein
MAETEVCVCVCVRARARVRVRVRARVRVRVCVCGTCEVRKMFRLEIPSGRNHLQGMNVHVRYLKNWAGREGVFIGFI